MGRGAQRPGEDTEYQHLTIVDGMAGWHPVGPLRGLLLIPVTIRDESRRGPPARPSDAQALSLSCLIVNDAVLDAVGTG